MAALNAKASYSIMRGKQYVTRVEQVSEYAQFHLDNLYDRAMNKVYAEVQKHLNDIYIRTINTIYMSKAKEKSITELNSKQDELLKVLAEIKQSDSQVVIDNYKNKHVKLI